MKRKDSNSARQAPHISNPAIVVLWTATNHLSLTGVITRFLPGAAVEQSFIRHGFGFYSSSFTYRF